MNALLTLKPLVDIRVYIERSRWVLARWTICALFAASGVAMCWRISGRASPSTDRGWALPLRGDAAARPR